MNLPAAPPQNLEAEQRVLGTLIVFYKPQLVHIVQAAGLKWNDFYRPANVIVYRAVLKLHKGGEHVDHITLPYFLRCQRHETAGTWLDAAGGEAYLELLSSYASVDGLRECARIVASDGRWRRWLTAMFDGLEAVHARDEDAFWAALGRVREDVLPGELKAIDGGKEQAA